MKKKIPIPKGAHKPSIPEQTPPAPDPKLSFSFTFYNQREFFGLSTVDSKWFISLIVRLGNLNQHYVEEVLSNQALRKTLRFHEIDWEAKNIPIQRNEFTWIPEVFLNNPVEYPFFQISVSRALGRIVGFFDASNIFQIILLDPLHNIQPSQYNDYVVRPSDPEHDLYSHLLNRYQKLDALMSSKCPFQDNECKLKENVQMIKADIEPYAIFFVPLEVHNECEQHKKNDLTILEIIEYGLLAVEKLQNNSY